MGTRLAISEQLKCFLKEAELSFTWIMHKGAICTQAATHKLHEDGVLLFCGPAIAVLGVDIRDAKSALIEQRGLAEVEAIALMRAAVNLNTIDPLTGHIRRQMEAWVA